MQNAYNEVFESLSTKEEGNDLYHLVRQREQGGKDVRQVQVIEDGDGNVLTSEESMLRGWRE